MTTTTSEPITLTITRVFDVPRALVWRAWTDKAWMANWLYPKDFTFVFAENDLRVGGAWRSGMRSSAGDVFVMGGTYREISEPERLRYTHHWEEHPDYAENPIRDTDVTVELEDLGGRTRMTFIQSGFRNVESRDDHGNGWSGAFEHLVAALTAP